MWGNRRVLAPAFVAAVSGLLVAALCFGVILPSRRDSARTLAARPAASERFLQVVAHADDDLLFMSPDLYGSVAWGAPTATVYLTGGESAAGLDDHRDARRYARQREDGVRAAYAYLAGEPDLWRRQLLELPHGLRLWSDTLLARPEITLLFVGIPDGGDPRADGGKHALSRLWENGAKIRTISGAQPSLDRASLTALLRAVFDWFRPTTLRTLDPDPHPPAGDHPDHVVSARLALAVAHGRNVRVHSYRGYTMTRMPANLDPRLSAIKRQVFEIYRGHDYRVGMGRRTRAWLERMYPLRTPPTRASGTPVGGG